MSEAHIKKIVQARISLLFQHPFFGQVSLGLKLKEADEWCDTMAVDGKYLYYNTKFVDSLNTQEMIFLVGHEVMHVVYEHFIRKNNRNSLLFNIAGDYVINDILKKNNVGTSPALALHDVKYSGMTTEQVYDLLFKKFKNALDEKVSARGKHKADNKSSSSPTGDSSNSESTTSKNAEDDLIEELANIASQLLDEVIDGADKSKKESKSGDDTPSCRPSYSEEELQEISDNVKANVVNAARSAGKMPAGLERLIETLTEPQINWKDELSSVIQSSIVSDYTFYRSNKKSGTFILPGLQKENTINIAAAFDMSGSISQKEASAFLAELVSIMQQYTEYEIDVWSYDTIVYSHTRITPQDDITTFTPRGGGGTDFNVNYSHMRDNDIKPDIFINFTDGYPYGSWGEEDYCNNQIFCIASSLSNRDRAPSPPFGKAIYITT
jgi:predicted metal-dependent peptidase